MSSEKRVKSGLVKGVPNKFFGCICVENYLFVVISFSYTIFLFGRKVASFKGNISLFELLVLLEVDPGI